MINSHLKYFLDFWNYTDLFIAIVLLAYSVIKYIDVGGQSTQRDILAALNLFSWFRALSHLRLF